MRLWVADDDELVAAVGGRIRRLTPREARAYAAFAVERGLQTDAVRLDLPMRQKCLIRWTS